MISSGLDTDRVLELFMSPWSGKISIDFQIEVETLNYPGFAVDEESLPDNVVPTHRSLFDGTRQGIAIKDQPAFSFQGHPEASPGPHDLLPLFERFIADMEAQKRRTIKSVISS